MAASGFLMWRVLFLICCLHVLMATSKPLNDPESSEWIKELAFDGGKKMRRDEENGFQKTTYLPEDLQLALMYAIPPQDKRSISMLAHWSGLSNIGKQRTSIREHPRWNAEGLSSITAETRARPGGQPLRWG